MAVLTDDQVITILRSTLLQGFSDQNLSFEIDVEQAYQVIDDNADSQTTVYIHKLDGNNMGWPGTRQVFNEATDQYDTITTFQGQVTYQFSAFTLRDPLESNYMSANNILELTFRIMQTPSTVATLQLSNISMQRIMNISQAYFDDDRKLFEQSPTFQVVLSYEQTIGGTVPKAYPVELSINRV
jgi:hypothetical protein